MKTPKLLQIEELWENSKGSYELKEDFISHIKKDRKY